MQKQGDYLNNSTLEREQQCQMNTGVKTGNISGSSLHTIRVMCLCKTFQNTEYLIDFQVHVIPSLADSNNFTNRTRSP